jgi:hypothetical protein
MEIPSKRIEIFTKAKISLKVSLKCHKFLKKSLAFSKIKKPRGNCRIATMASPPLHMAIHYNVNSMVKLKMNLFFYCVFTASSSKKR